MASFSQVMRGKRARKPVAFPQLNRRSRLLDDVEELKAARADHAGQAPPDSSEPPILVDLVVLTGDEEAQALANARAFAVARGVPDAECREKDGSALYALGIMVYTLLAGILDHDSPDDAPRAFFDSAEQILKNLDRDRIVYLHALHEVWQDECSPQARDLSSEQFYRWVMDLAKSEGPDDPPFADLRSGTLWSYMRTLAALYLNSLQVNSPPIAGSDGTTSDATSKPPPSSEVH